MILYLGEFVSFPAHKLLSAGSGEISVNYQGIQGVNEAELDLDIQKSDDEFFCQGHLRASVSVECARCLKMSVVEVNNATDFVVCSRESHETRKDIIDSEDYVYYEGQNLKADLTDIVRQTIILSISMKPLCSEDCRGLCQKCGVNLNDASCTCQTTETDGRWEGLKKLSALTSKTKGITDASS